MYAKTGTEALAEKQKMEGKQSLDVLALRSKIVDWCLTPVLQQCDVALSEMAHLYIGDKKHGPKKHYVPIYRDKRSNQKSFHLLLQSCGSNLEDTC